MTRLRALVLALFLVMGLAIPGAAHADRATSQDLGWSLRSIHTDQEFRGLAAVSASTAWVSGSAGGVWRTTDGGKRWLDVSPENAVRAKLQLRDIEASDATHALALAIGGGRHSRIYRTDDGGQHWSRAFTNTDNDAFYDCLAMYPDGLHGLAMSDPVDGRFRLISTADGGASWQQVDPARMPRAEKGEFGFAASGTCLVTSGDDAYLASGGSAARIFTSHDFGQHWTVSRSTIPPAAAGGVFSMAFTHGRGIAVGGDYLHPELGRDMSAYQSGAGGRWVNGGDLGGYRSGVAWRHGREAVAVGPTGSDVSYDAGRSWTTFSRLDLDAVQCVHSACWASGTDGKVARLVEP